jgi:transcriptional regulator with XRE-family HTH domain
MSEIDNQVGWRLQALRKRAGLSIRQLAAQAGVTAAMISCVERGKNSPSIGILHKVLVALGTDLATFFGSNEAAHDGPVFLREQMRVVSDAERRYTVVFPRRDPLKVALFDEQFLPGKPKPPFEQLECDIAGYVLAGNLTLELKAAGRKLLRPGDAFYVPKGTAHRGYATGADPVRLITVYHPPRY